MKNMDRIYYPSKESVQEDLQELQNSGVDDFFHEHLQNLIDRYFLVDSYTPEADLLESHIYEIKRLNELYRGEFRNPFTRNTNTDISARFHSIIDVMHNGGDLSTIREEIEGMIDDELDRLADTFRGNTFRDTVEGAIDFKWSIRENYYESPAMTDFLLEFTIAYINFLEGDSGVSVESGDFPDELVLDQDSLGGVLSLALNQVRGNNQEFYDDILTFDIGFSLDSIGEIVINMSEFADGLDGDMLIQTSPDTLTEVPIPVVPVYEEPVQDVDTLIPSHELGEIQDTSPGNILNEYNSGNITWNEAMRILEGDSGFQENRNGGYSYGDALEQFGFGSSLEADINVIFGRELNENELNNIILMTRYFLYVESSGGYNVSNYEGVSTAKGYFQYLTGNGRAFREMLVNGEWIRQGDWNDATHTISPTVRRFWGTNSYETALGHLPDGINDRLIFAGEIEKIGNPNLQDPRDLSAHDQTILFLSDLLQRPGARTLSDQMLTGDVTAVQELYRLHHTDTDEATEFRMLLAGRDIYDIEVEIYTYPGDTVTGLVLPEDNITNFFVNLIREINPNTSLSRSEIMLSLDALGNIPFQAGSRINISRSVEDGVAYVLTLNGENYIQINADKTFIDLR